MNCFDTPEFNAWWRAYMGGCDDADTQYAGSIPEDTTVYPRYQVMAYLEVWDGEPQKDTIPGFFEGPDALLNARAYAEKLASQGGWFEDDDDGIQVFIPFHRVRSAWVEEMSEDSCDLGLGE